MRALCGAIITAGALIGLGLTAVGVGYRYQLYPYQSPEGKPQWVSFNHVDSTLMIVLAALLISLVVGWPLPSGARLSPPPPAPRMLREQTGQERASHHGLSSSARDKRQMLTEQYPIGACFPRSDH